MESLNFGGIASIALVGIVAVLIIYNAVKERGGEGGTGAQLPPQPVSDGTGNTDAIKAVLGAISAHSHSDAGFQEYTEDLTDQQKDDIPFYALVFALVQYASSRNRTAGTQAIADAVLPHGGDKELVHAADYFWESVYGGEMVIEKFCDEQLIGPGRDWPDSKKENIVLGGLLALRLVDPDMRKYLVDPEDYPRSLDRCAMDMQRVTEAFFQDEASAKFYELSARADAISPSLCEGLGLA